MRRWWVPIGAVLVTAGLCWWVWQVTMLDDATRTNASGYGQFVLAAVGLAVIVGGWAVQALRPAPVPDLNDSTDALALAMRNQWEDAANDRRLLQPAPLPIRWRRSTEPIAGPRSAATATRDGHVPFEPLPGLDFVTGNTLRSGTRRTLHRVYGGLASGRLLIVGGPGTGKSSAAVLLLLDALRYREQAAAEDRQRIPVPVLFTLSDWDPETVSVRDWLVTKLATIPLLQEKSGALLLQAGRVAVFLDGLDEIPERVRPLALRALSEQTTFRLVVLTRTAELADAAAEYPLVGAAAIELQPLRPADVADYLLRPLTEPTPAAWRNLTTALAEQPDSALGQALASPLNVSLLRDVYPVNSAVDELLDAERFRTPDDITDYLLDHAISAAYSQRPGQRRPPYSAQTAKHTLSLVAGYMNGRATRDFAWWETIGWMPRVARAAIGTLLSVVVLGLSFPFASNPYSVAAFSVVLGLGSGVLGTFMLGAPQRWRRVTWRRPFTPRALWFGVPMGVFIGALGWMRYGYAAALALGVVVGFAAALTMGARDLLHQETDSLSPLGSWRHDVTVGLAAGVTIGLPLTVVGGFTEGIFHGVAGVVVLLLGTVFTAMIGVSDAGSLIVTEIYLAVRYRTPLRLARFLEDARSRHLLRTVGPVYQFRHATLQDRLAPDTRLGGRGVPVPRPPS